MITPGDLARETLTYLLAERLDLAEVIHRAVAMPRADPLEVRSRFEPVTVGVGALVVLALQTDLQIERGTNGTWRIKLHKKAMSDSTLGKFLAKLVAAYGGGPGAQMAPKRRRRPRIEDLRARRIDARNEPICPPLAWDTSWYRVRILTGS